MQKILFYLSVFLIVAGLGFAAGYYTSPSPIVQNVGITTQSGLNLTKGDLTVADNAYLNGTSTIAMSYDGFFAQGNFSIASGTAKAVYTNGTGKPLLCSGGGIFANSLSTTLGPSLTFSLGTSTSATAYVTNLMASTTVATTTDTFIATKQWFSRTDLAASSGNATTTGFILPAGSSIIGNISDPQPYASSTYYTSAYWDVDFALPCTMIGS